MKHPDPRGCRATILAPAVAAQTLWGPSVTSVHPKGTTTHRARSAIATRMVSPKTSLPSGVAMLSPKGLSVPVSPMSWEESAMSASPFSGICKGIIQVRDPSSLVVVQGL